MVVEGRMAQHALKVMGKTKFIKPDGLGLASNHDACCHTLDFLVHKTRATAVMVPHLESCSKVGSAKECQGD